MFKLRFWWVVLRAFLFPSRNPRSHLRFWVTPFDCDINLHLNNAFYLKYMDLGRWEIVVRLRFVPLLLRAKLQPVVVRVEIDYKKALPPGAFFTLETHFEEIGEKTFTVRQTFRQNARVVADARVTGVFVHAGRAVPTHRFTELLPPDLKALIHQPHPHQMTE